MTVISKESLVYFIESKNEVFSIVLVRYRFLKGNATYLNVSCYNRIGGMSFCIFLHMVLIIKLFNIYFKKIWYI